MFCIALVVLFCFPLHLPTFWATINSSMCSDHSIQLCLHPDPWYAVSGVRHDVNTFWNDESYLQWFLFFFHHDTVAPWQMESIKAVLLCSSFLLVWKSIQYIYCSSKWKCHWIEIKPVVYTQSVTHWREGLRKAPVVLPFSSVFSWAASSSLLHFSASRCSPGFSL